MIRQHISTASNSAPRLLAAALIAMAALAGGCASTGATAGEAEADESAERQRLGQMINVCTLERLKLERARQRWRGRFGDLMRLSAAYAHGSAIEARDTGSSAGRWDDVDNFQVSYGPDGMRISGRVDTFETITVVNAAVAVRLGGPHFDIASVERGDGDGLRFELVEPAAMVDPLHGIELGPDAFEARAPGQPLADYAEQVCSFGGERPLRLQMPAEGWSVDDPRVEVDEFWKKSVLRAHLEDDRGIDTALLRLDHAAVGYEGAHIRREPSGWVVDLVAHEPADELDAGAWLARLGLAGASLQLPAHDDLITWRRHEDGYPVGVPRSLLSGASRYTFERVAHAYEQLAGVYAQLATVEDYTERTGASMRALLCALRAFGTSSDGHEHGPSASLEAAGVSFDTPTKPGEYPLELTAVDIEEAGVARWEFAGATTTHLNDVSEALDSCAADPDYEATITATTDGARLQAAATVQADGMLEIKSPESLDIRRFEDGPAFVRAAINEPADLERQFRRQARQLANTANLARRIPSSTLMLTWFNSMLQAADRFEIDAVELERRPVDPHGWRHVHPIRADVTATGPTAQVIGFAAELLDADRMVVPVRVRLSDVAESPGHVELRATLFAFTESSASKSDGRRY